MVVLKSHDAVGLAAHLLGYGPVVGDALRLAAYAHDGQFRRETRSGVEYKDPYIVHPIRNALRVARFTEGHLSTRMIHDLVIDSLLHDTVEDASDRVAQFYSPGDAPEPDQSRALGLIAHHFGVDVADTVSRVTNPKAADTSPSRDARNQAYLEHLRERVVSSESAFLTKASDLIDNAGSLKHMLPGDKRSALSLKYQPPVELMIYHTSVVSDEAVRETVRARLALVKSDLAELTAAS